MASTLFSTLSRISPAHISNQYTTATNTPFAGVLVKGTKQGIKSYTDLDAITEDYEAYTPLWKKARAYFAGNSEATGLLVVTFAPGETPAATVPASGSESDGSGATASTTTTDLSADATGAVTALKKYFFAGPQFWFLAEFDDEVSQAVSNFVQLQNTGLFVAYSNDATKLQGYAGNNKTYKITLPAVDDSAVDVRDVYNNVADAAFSGVMDGRNPHSAVKYALGNLPYTKPQNDFEFTPDDQAELDKYHIATYAYVFATPSMTSSETSADQFHLDTILGWDWIQNQTNARIANLFVQNAKQGISYSELGFSAVVNVIKGVFIDAGDLNIIAPELDADGNETGKPDYSVDYVKPGELPKSYEIKREMRGVTTKYHPMGMVEDVYIENTIVM